MAEASSNFIKTRINEDLAAGRVKQLVTRFPPEPNGYLHIGHAKAICINFGLAEEYGKGLDAHCNLRFDDTNPEKEDQDFVEAIMADIQWLGFRWQGTPRYASDYFPRLYDYACALINKGLAYVCDLSAEEQRSFRGSLTEPGSNSPYRERSVEENMALFTAMRAGEFEEGSRVLRAKIDMASPNMNMRDPVIYRIRFIEHHQTGKEWPIYPLYDFTHCLSDAEEGITHSLCSLEFEDHRPLYDWFIEQLDTPSKPKQTEFARLNLNYTITSKRKLRRLVDEGVVSGWDDPRMPTLSGMRRRGYTPASIRAFIESVGVARANSIVDVSMLEFAIRDDLDKNAARAMCVLDPVRLVLTNYEEGKEELLSLPRHPKDDSLGRREVPFTRELFIDRADFAAEPPAKWKRLAPDNAVRLRGAYVIQFERAEYDEEGLLQTLFCRFDPETLGKNPTSYKAKGVIHWVSAQLNQPAEVRVYDRLFNVENPAESGKDFFQHLNPDSKKVFPQALAEQSLARATPEEKFQFEREGYFCVDRYEGVGARMVFNRVVALRDGWAGKKT